MKDILPFSPTSVRAFDKTDRVRDACANSSSDEKPGWRVPIRVALFWVGSIAILLLGSFPRNMAPPSWAQAVWVVWGAVLVYAMTLAFVRLEGRSLREVGFGVDAATVLRFALDTLQRRFGVWPAVITAAFFFALSHVAFGWSWNDVLLGVFPNGVLFGMVTVASRGLAMPTAVHAAINLSQWSFGEDGGSGPWKIVVDPSALARVQAVAPLATLAVYVLAILVAWKWYRRMPAR